jgi:hypothetical protein
MEHQQSPCRAENNGRSVRVGRLAVVATSVVAGASLVGGCALGQGSAGQIKRQQALLDAMKRAPIAQLQVPGGRLTSTFSHRGSGTVDCGPWCSPTNVEMSWRIGGVRLRTWYSVLAEARQRGVTFSTMSCSHGFLSAGGEIEAGGEPVGLLLSMGAWHGPHVQLELETGPAIGNRPYAPGVTAQRVPHHLPLTVLGCSIAEEAVLRRATA